MITTTPSTETLASNFKYQLLRLFVPELESLARKRLSSEIVNLDELAIPDSAKKVALMFVRSIDEDQKLSKREASILRTA
jgi:hypothetical protein